VMAISSLFPVIPSESTKQKVSWNDTYIDDLIIIIEVLHLSYLNNQWERKLEAVNDMKFLPDSRTWRCLCSSRLRWAHDLQLTPKTAVIMVSNKMTKDFNYILHIYISTTLNHTDFNGYQMHDIPRDFIRTSCMLFPAYLNGWM
jgi:hypothetical protein